MATAAAQIDYTADFLRGDQIEYRRHCRRAWLPGYVVRVEPGAIWIQLNGESFFKKVPAGRGEVRKMDIKRHVELLFAPPSKRPELRIVHGGAADLHPQPKPRKPWRSGVYLAFVRKHTCCACGRSEGIEAHHTGIRGVGQKASDATCVPLCGGCHRIVTDTNALPGRTQAETAAHFAVVALGCLSDWLSRRKRLDEAEHLQGELEKTRSSLKEAVRLREIAAGEVERLRQGGGAA